MRIMFTESAWEDYQWFLERDRKLLKRINTLIKDVLRSPFTVRQRDEYVFVDKDGRSVELPGRPWMALRITRIGDQR